MPKLFGLHEVVLPPGMTAEEYEQLFGKELASCRICRVGKPISSRVIAETEPASFS
jgi:hypothetical protein